MRRITWLVICLALLATGCARHGKGPGIGVQSQTAKNGFIVILDPGHGGKAQGARCQIFNYQEKHMTLSTAFFLKKHLEEMGYTIVMTREKDHDLSLPARIKIAEKSKGHIFVSLHYNSSSNPKAQGIEVYYHDSKANAKRTASSKALATDVYNQVISNTKAASRGVRSAGFQVIAKTTMPPILVEGGFLTNHQERARLKDPQYLDNLALGIANGINRYFQR